MDGLWGGWVGITSTCVNLVAISKLTHSLKSLFDFSSKVLNMLVPTIGRHLSSCRQSVNGDLYTLSTRPIIKTIYI